MHTGIDELKSYYPHPRYSEAEMKRRYAAVGRNLKASDLDCLLVYGQGMDHANIRYLSDYEQMGFSYILVPRSGPPTLFYGFAPAHDPTARIMSVIPDVRFAGQDAGGALAEELKRRGLGKARIAVAGCTGPSYTIALPPADHFDRLRSELPKASFVSAPFFVDEIRMVKSPEEIARYERAAAIGDEVMRAVIEGVAEGVTDYDLVRIAQRKTAELGGAWTFQIIGSTPMDRPNLITPHKVPLRRPIRRGDVVITEIGTAFGGCEAQTIRPIAFGPPTQQYRDLYNLTLEVYNRLCDALRPGKTSRDLWAAGDPIRKRGLKYQILAHGLSPMEPYITALDDLIRPYALEEGMLIEVEPKPYIGEHFTGDGVGMFIGNSVLVTANGPRTLQKLPLEFFQV